ncbi:MAG: carbohydrate binding domain-containing protein [Oscillospiraceae bacterium]|nr:carbohydrate binding domain-containing protein [Oscillospiraceae bacterium]
MADNISYKEITELDSATPSDDDLLVMSKDNTAKKVKMSAVKTYTTPTTDAEPTQGSTNPVTSGGVYSALQGKQDTLTFDSEPTSGSTNPVTSDGVFNGIVKVLPTATASGIIASFDDGADDVPVKSLEVDIEPVQAGSGDPSPDNVRSISGWTGAEVWNDPKYGGTVAWNQLIRNGNFSDGTQYWTGREATLTVTDGVARATLRGAAWNNDIRQGTVPLSDGHVYFLSVMCRQSSENFSLFFRNPGGQFTTKSFRGTAWSKFEVCGKITAPVSTGFALSVIQNGTTLANEWFEAQNFNAFDLTQMLGSTVADYIYNLEQTTTGAGVAYFRELFPNDYYPFDDSYTETCVSAVNGDAYSHHTIPFGQTVYGGTLDVTNGVLTVDRAMVDLGTLSWGKQTTPYNATRYYSYDVRSSAKEAVDGIIPIANALCSEFLLASANAGFAGVIKDCIAIDTQATLSVYPTASYADATSFKSAMNGVQLVYELATPITYQLTPTEVTTLLGQNNIWADTGDVTVTYRQDIGLALNKLNNAILSLGGNI